MCDRGRSAKQRDVDEAVLGRRREGTDDHRRAARRRDQRVDRSARVQGAAAAGGDRPGGHLQRAYGRSEILTLAVPEMANCTNRVLLHIRLRLLGCAWRVVADGAIMMPRQRTFRTLPTKFLECGDLSPLWVSTRL